MLPRYVRYHNNNYCDNINVILCTLEINYSMAVINENHQKLTDIQNSLNLLTEQFMIKINMWILIIPLCTKLHFVSQLIKTSLVSITE